MKAARILAWIAFGWAAIEFLFIFSTTAWLVLAFALPVTFAALCVFGTYRFRVLTWLGTAGMMVWFFEPYYYTGVVLLPASLCMLVAAIVQTFFDRRQSVRTLANGGRA